MGSQFRSSMSGVNSGLDSMHGAKYLFHHDDEKATVKGEDRMSTPDIKSYLKLTEPDDKFPTLSRRHESGLVSQRPYSKNSLTNWISALGQP